MKVVFSDNQLDHDPKSFLSSGAEMPNPELPGRAHRCLQAALASGLEQVAPEDDVDDVPTVIVQEGGYLSAELGDNLVSFLRGFRRS